MFPTWKQNVCRCAEQCAYGLYCEPRRQYVTVCTALQSLMDAWSCREVEAVEERAVDRHGNKYMTIKELQEQEAQRRAGLPTFPLLHMI